MHGWAVQYDKSAAESAAHNILHTNVILKYSISFFLYLQLLFHNNILHTNVMRGKDSKDYSVKNVATGMFR